MVTKSLIITNCEILSHAPTKKKEGIKEGDSMRKLKKLGGYLKRDLLRQAVGIYPDFAELICYYHFGNCFSHFAGYNEKLCLHNL